MNLIKEVKKYFLITVMFTIGFIVVLPGFLPNWAFIFSFSFILFELPVFFETKQLSLFHKAILILGLCCVNVLMILFLCQAEQVNQYLKNYFCTLLAVIAALSIKTAYLKHKSSRKSP